MIDYNEFLQVVVSEDGGADDHWSYLGSPLDVPCLRVLRGHTAGITSLAYLTSSSLIASASLDGTLRLWDPTGCTHRLTHPRPQPHLHIWPGYYARQPVEFTTDRSYTEVRLCFLQSA